MRPMCACSCHRQLGVMHVAPCCDYPPLDALIEYARLDAGNCSHPGGIGVDDCDCCLARRALKDVGYTR